MIPKKLIYCWFGFGKKPKLVENCIDSWKRIVPDYEVYEINENNWDVSEYDYSKKAYEEKKWAFVNDIAKLSYVYENGGITLDADVEIIKPFTKNMLSQRAFTSKESSGKWISAVIAAEKQHPWIRKILRYYNKNEFVYDPRNITNTIILDGINKSWYKETIGDIIFLHEDVVIYPRCFLECKNWSTGKIEITDDSCCIHHYLGSWLS